MTTVISPRLGNKGRWAGHPCTCPLVCDCPAELLGTPQRDSAQCGPVLWLLRTYQSRLWSFWLLITMERKLIWIFLNMTRVFLFTLVSCCSISSLSLVVSPFYEPTIMWEPLPASVGFLQHGQEVVSPVCAAANTDLGVGKFRPQFWRHHSHHSRPLKSHSSHQLGREAPKGSCSTVE